MEMGSLLAFCVRIEKQIRLNQISRNHKFLSKHTFWLSNWFVHGVSFSNSLFTIHMDSIYTQFKLKYFDFEENHEVNWIVEVVALASNCKSKFKKITISFAMKNEKMRDEFITCWRIFAGDAGYVRIKLEMYTLTNVAIRNWQSNRSIIPPCPGIISPKSCCEIIKSIINIEISGFWFD